MPCHFASRVMSSMCMLNRSSMIEMFVFWGKRSPSFEMGGSGRGGSRAAGVEDRVCFLEKPVGS